MSTIKEVANAAGVSTATVSRVLNNNPSVKPETVKIVKKKIHDLNYTPNILAAQMRKQETRTVVVLVPDISNTFFSEIILGIESRAIDKNYQVLIADLGGSNNSEDYYFKAIQEHRFDGIISLSASVAKHLIEKLAKKYPIVIACQYLENDNIPNVAIDNKSAAFEITEHLIKLGHKKIAHITADPSLLLYRDRLNGYISALAKYKIPIDLELVGYGLSSVESGFTCMKRLLEQQKDITAVFAAGDVMAIGAIQAIKAAGLKVPDDIAVVGFDDIDFSSFCDPALTTVQQPRKLIGQLAFDKVWKMIKGIPLEKCVDKLDYSIIIRDSCGYSKKRRIH